jgi:hypothetical protein
MMNPTTGLRHPQADHQTPELGWWNTSWTAVAAIWVSSIGLAVLAPDMISGSEHEHLPLAMMTVWPWSAAATAFALMTPGVRAAPGWTGSVVVLWAGTMLAGVLAPSMVTGTDPTEIPLAVVVVPPVAAILTGLLSLHQANQLARSDPAFSSGGSSGR